MSWLRKTFGTAGTSHRRAASVLQGIDGDRQAYVSALHRLVTDVRRDHDVVFPEMMMVYGGEAPEIYRRMRIDVLYRVGDKVAMAEANLKPPSPAPPVQETWNGLAVSVHPLVWNAVEFVVRGPAPAESVLGAWLDRWYDAAEARDADADGLHGVVHNMTAPEEADGRWTVSIDFGSSDLDAFTAFIDLVRQTGATTVDIGSFSFGSVSAPIATTT